MALLNGNSFCIFLPNHNLPIFRRKIQTCKQLKSKPPWRHACNSWIWGFDWRRGVAFLRKPALNKTCPCTPRTKVDALSKAGPLCAGWGPSPLPDCKHNACKGFVGFETTSSVDGMALRTKRGKEPRPEPQKSRRLGFCKHNARMTGLERARMFVMAQTRSLEKLIRIWIINIDVFRSC